jgi:hypothetical protein
MIQSLRNNDDDIYIKKKAQFHERFFCRLQQRHWTCRWEAMHQAVLFFWKKKKKTTAHSVAAWILSITDWHVWCCMASHRSTAGYVWHWHTTLSTRQPDFFLHPFHKPLRLTPRSQPRARHCFCGRNVVCVGSRTGEGPVNALPHSALKTKPVLACKYLRNKSNDVEPPRWLHFACHHPYSFTPKSWNTPF